MDQFQRKMHVTDRLPGHLYIWLIIEEDNSRIILPGVSWEPVQMVVPFSETTNTGEEQICVAGS